MIRLLRVPYTSDRPGKGYTWDGTQWVAPDPKVVHNARIDALIDSLERQEILARMPREYMLVDAVNTVLTVQGIEIDQATSAQRAAAMGALLTPGSPIYSLGIAKTKTFDDQIVALRAQRIP